MAVRADEDLKKALIKVKTVAAGQTVDANYPVKYASSDDEVQKIAALTDDGIGISLDAGVAGDQVRIVMLGSNAFVKCKVGTGGATRGAPAVYAADGLTNGTVGGGTAKRVSYGQFTQNGLVGDLVGLNMASGGHFVGA